MFRHVMICYATDCYVFSPMLCYAMFCYVILGYVMLCCVMLCMLCMLFPQLALHVHRYICIHTLVYACTDL